MKIILIVISIFVLIVMGTVIKNSSRISQIEESARLDRFDEKRQAKTMRGSKRTFYEILQILW